MAILGNDYLTLADLNSRLKSTGYTVENDIVEILNERNEILDDMIFREGNLPTGHKFTVRTEVPEPTWRQLYKGNPYQKSKTAQVTETCGILVNRSLIDCDEAELAGDVKAFRNSEEKAFVEGFGQKVAKELFYGSQEVTKEGITGFAPRFASSSSGDTSGQVISAGGSGSDNTSIWLIGWGDNGAFMTYPKGSKVGLSMEDLGKQQITADGGAFSAYVSEYKWKLGLCVRNYKNIVRISNIDVSNLQTAGDTSDSSANIEKLMMQAIGAIKNPSSVKLAFYMTRATATMLKIRLFSRSNTYLRIEDYLGRKNVLTFQGYPIRIVDQLLETEAAI